MLNIKRRSGDLLTPLPLLYKKWVEDSFEKEKGAGGMSWNVMAIKQIARYLRIHQTPSEKILWEKLRNRKLEGKKFLRQHPIVFTIGGERRFFVADFYCAEHRLVVEIDGKMHERRKDHDEMREWVMNELGYAVVRFPNEIVENNCNAVIDELRERLTTHPRPLSTE